MSDYATAQRDGFTVPLIGVPKSAEPSKGDFRDDGGPATSDTPRTDAACNAKYTLDALCTLSQQLERELNAVRADRDHVLELLEERSKQRDQWRECAESLAASLKLWHPEALSKFNALKAQSKT